MSNYSILQQNTLLGLGETAGVLYLRLCDQFRDERRAFFEACRFDKRVAGPLDRIWRSPCFDDMPDHTRQELNVFMAERWRHNFMSVTSQTKRGKGV